MLGYSYYARAIIQLKNSKMRKIPCSSSETSRKMAWNIAKIRDVRQAYHQFRIPFWFSEPNKFENFRRSRIPREDMVITEGLFEC